MKNYYDILQVNKNANKEVISKVYKYLIKKNHPDLFTGKEKERAEIEVTKLNEAYDILSDDVKRKEFDEELEYYNSLSQSPNTIIQELRIENDNLKMELYEKTQLLNKIYEQIPLDEYGTPLNHTYNVNTNKKGNETLKDYFTRTFSDFFIRIIILIFFLFSIVLISSTLIGKNILIPNTSIEKSIE